MTPTPVWCGNMTRRGIILPCQPQQAVSCHQIGPERVVPVVFRYVQWRSAVQVPPLFAALYERCQKFGWQAGLLRQSNRQAGRQTDRRPKKLRMQQCSQFALKDSCFATRGSVVSHGPPKTPMCASTHLKDPFLMQMRSAFGHRRCFCGQTPQERRNQPITPQRLTGN